MKKTIFCHISAHFEGFYPSLTLFLHSFRKREREERERREKEREREKREREKRERETCS